MYNTTQLNPETSFEKHVFHRDQFAHYLRWSHVLKIAEIGMNILDFGCGSGNIYEVFYRNKFAPKRFLGLDIRKQTIEKNKIKFPKAEWGDEDLVNMKQNYGNDWDIITSFEVLEHIGKNNGDKFLQNIRLHSNDKTIILFQLLIMMSRLGPLGIILMTVEMAEVLHLKNILIKNYKNYSVSISSSKRFGEHSHPLKIIKNI